VLCVFRFHQFHFEIYPVTVVSRRGGAAGGGAGSMDRSDRGIQSSFLDCTTSRQDKVMWACDICTYNNNDDHL